ncbi:DUF6588 family protein [Saccharicrinis fermentans]|uniref:Uncharacterized protein n=1 Tax=Saccharicrinis fermentans DSM 9555 = JCM 21142 TaxID=869213 RepID=W7YL98_9BACT|nr:DUF6588 family protein [Saccharicrinis fermentans]GAF03109.1 hypothetical protein JCM21142_41768 [Saccharicrinis fermentans DSM 9555 = JCM 21142]
MRKTFIFLLLAVGVSIVKGQKEVVTFLQVPELSQGLAMEYLSPMGEMMHGNLHSGWYRTAKTHRFLGFDISLSMSATTTPSDQRGYYIDQIPDFQQNYILKDGSFSIAANMAGQTTDFPVIRNRTDGREIQLPKGKGEDRISLPVLSGGIGLPYNSELRVKLMPKLDMGNTGEVSQYGVGLKHSVKEYIPVLANVPVLSLAVWGSYAFMSNDIKIDYPNMGSPGQSLEGVMTGLSAKLLVGIDVPVFSAYMGLGYVSSNVDYTLKGNYYVGDPAALLEETNPLSVKYEFSRMALDFGVKAKIGMVELFAGYAPGEYGTMSLGAGVAFR